MPSDALKNALEKEFSKHRLVFLDDKNGVNRSDFDDLNLDDVTKIVIENNEFTVKYRVLIKEREQKFLFYRANGAPDDSENWLLDLQVCSGVFRLDPVSLRLSELGLPADVFFNTLKAHESFFLKKENRERLLRFVEPANETPSSLELKMMCLLSPLRKAAHFDEFVLSLIKVQSNLDKDEKEKGSSLMPGGADATQVTFPENQGALRETFLKVLADQYGFDSKAEGGEKPLVAFVNKLYRDYLGTFTGEPRKLNQNARMLLDQWRQNSTYLADLKYWALSEDKSLSIEYLLKQSDIDFEKIARIDLFISVDLKLISELSSQILNNKISKDVVGRIKDLRRNSFFYEDFKFWYEMLYEASVLLNEIPKLSKDYFFNTTDEAVGKYTENFYRIDTAYRKFCLSYQNRNDFSDPVATLNRDIVEEEQLRELKDKVDRIYAKEFIDPLGCKFAECAKGWSQNQNLNVSMQLNFFNRVLKPAINNNKRVNKWVVIISDGLRYELGAELYKRLNAENRNEAEIRPMLSAVPSYTQLGMAALLPHESLTFSDKKNDVTIMVDGQNSSGIGNRETLLQKCGLRTHCYQASDLEKITSKALREEIKNYDLIFIYHDVVDNAGEHDEANVFKKCEDCLASLQDLIKKLTSANINNLMVTSDHGFIYEDLEIDYNRDCVDIPVIKGTALIQKDRFIVLNGESAVDDSCYLRFKSEDLGLKEGKEVIVPASSARFRRQGQKSRYFHGGVSLQECVIPLIRLSRVRADNVIPVEVELLTKEIYRRITANTITLRFYQKQRVETGFKKSVFNVAFYADPLSHEPVSDCLKLEFSSTDQETAARESSETFNMKSNLQVSKVYLRMDRIDESGQAVIDEQTIPFKVEHLQFERDDFD